MTTPSSHSPDAQRTTLAILAGGKGTRMGQPKGSLLLNNRPILQYLLDRFAWPGPTLLVTAPGQQHPPAWTLFDRETSDPVPDQGPLRGILTALDAAHGNVLITTVDMPALSPHHFHWLLTQFATKPSLHGLLLRRDGRIEPFPSLFRPTAAAPIRHRLESEKLAVHDLLSDPGFEAIDAPLEWPPETWTNLNRPEDVEAFRRMC